MAFPFFKRAPKIDTPINLSATTDQMISLMEIAADPRLLGVAESQIKNFVDSASNFQAFQDMTQDGGYFGSEFNIRATAGRIKGTYSSEPWVFACATLIAKALSSVPMIVVDAVTKKKIEGHPLQTKINLGNRLQDNRTIEWAGDLDLILGGNFFRAFNSTFTEMMQIPVESATLNIAPDKQSIESIRVYDTTGKATATTIPYSQVIHHKFPNPYNPYYGLSLFTAASRPILLDRFKNEFEMAFYLRGATNSGVIETTEDINRTRMERLMRTFEQVYTGKRNWWRTIFLPKGAKWIKSGLSMTEMQHLEGLRENRLVILAVLGIPPSKLGIVQDVNRSTSDNQDKDFWENTIKPLAQFIAAGWNNSYLVKTIYNNRVLVQPDFSAIPVLQGTLQQKGEEAATVEKYLTINEIRKDILKYPELPTSDERGNKFVAEIKSSAPPSLASGQDLMVTPANETPSSTPNDSEDTEQAPDSEDPVSDVVSETDNNKASFFASLKAQVIASQDRIENKLTQNYKRGYEKYISTMLDIAVEALHKNHSVAKVLSAAERKLAKIYIDEVEPTLVSALERGFSFALSQSKLMTSDYLSRKIISSAHTKKLRFNETDQQAVDALRDSQRDGRRRLLVERSIKNFVGFNKTRTNQVLDKIAEGTDKGETFEQTAANLRQTYQEAYKDQAFTVTRTEVLTAISEGMKWNHDVLSEVFSDVQKQWFHVGDIGSNPDARLEHYNFEQEGPVDKDYSWGGTLDYPRDPNGDASDTINCRCSMTSIIPDNATSNAEIVLDSLL